MLLIALFERSQLSCERQLCWIRLMVVVSAGLLFPSEDLAVFSKLEEVTTAQCWPVVSIREPGGFSIPSYSSPVLNPWSQVPGSSIMHLTSGPRIQTKILMACFQGPRFEFQFQVHGVVSCRPTPLFVICDLIQAMGWVLLGGPSKLELLWWMSRTAVHFFLVFNCSLILEIWGNSNHSRTCFVFSMYIVSCLWTSSKVAHWWWDRTTPMDF